jgi:hypothetical protein
MWGDYKKEDDIDLEALKKGLADGALHSYSIESESIHSLDPGTQFVVLVTNGAEGLDKFNAAVADMGKNNPAAMAAYQSLITGKGTPRYVGSRQYDEQQVE